MKHRVSCLGSWALAAALIAMTMPVFGQEAPNKQPTPDPQQQTQTQTQNPSTESQPTSQSAQQTFQGTISQSESGYVLKDSTGTTYQLDDQKKAKDFSGQSVKVTGSLDNATNMIRVSSIAPAS